MSGPDLAGVPSRCTVCDTPIPPGQARCPGCARVFGEDNRCHSCSAIVGVRATPRGYACLACGKPRERLPGTVVMGGGDDIESASRMTSALIRALGIASIGGGIFVGALSAAVLPGALGLGLAAILGLGGVGFGALALRFASRHRVKASEDAMKTRQRQVGALAKERGGILTPADVAAEMALTESEADALLTSLTDGEKVSLEITDEGGLEYHFHGLIQSPRVRVAPLLEEGVEVEADAGSTAEREAER